LFFYPPPFFRSTSPAGSLLLSPFPFLFLPVAESTSTHPWRFPLSPRVSFPPNVVAR
jgi:hypothetical protein